MSARLLSLRQTLLSPISSHSLPLLSRPSFLFDVPSRLSSSSSTPPTPDAQATPTPTPTPTPATPSSAPLSSYQFPQFPSSRITEKQEALKGKHHQESLASRKRVPTPSSSLRSSTTASTPTSDWQNAFKISTSTPSSKGTYSPTEKFPTPETRWGQISPVSYSQPVTTTSARSFVVSKAGGAGLALAYRSLNRVLMENNIRRELKQKDRFESGSDKRVRLDSERHRRRFKVAVGKAVSLAMRNV